MTPRPEIETQFVVRLDERYRGVVARHKEQLTGALGQALVVSFGLPFPSPVRVTVRFGKGSDLLEANGVTNRVPDPQEIYGLLIGVVIGVTTALTLQPRTVDLTRVRISDG